MKENFFKVTFVRRVKKGDGNRYSSNNRFNSVLTLIFYLNFLNFFSARFSHFSKTSILFNLKIFQVHS